MKYHQIRNPNIEISTLLNNFVQNRYINSEVVIPAKAGIQIRKTGFRIKSGMTDYVK
jgi:hypothetical protein